MSCIAKTALCLLGLAITLCNGRVIDIEDQCVCAAPDCLDYVRGPGPCHCPICPGPLSLTCPKLPPGTNGLCAELCSTDKDCPKGQLCCSNGCGHQCKVGVPVEDVCKYNGQVYKPGDSFPSTDGCNTCFCGSGGLVGCTKKACPQFCVKDGVKYKVGEQFPAGDGCNTCTCLVGGQIACTEIACGPICPPDKPLVNCLIDPCMFASCPNHPDARCVADYCGGCNARFFIREEEVTDTCTCPVKGQIFKRCASACPANCTDPTPICTRQCVARCECPAGEVIDEQKNQCVPVKQCPAGTCEQGGVTYQVGDNFPAGDGCNTCGCIRPDVIVCTLIACEVFPTEIEKQG